MLLECLLSGRSSISGAAARCPRAAVIGICKNAGKTVALNRLIAEAAAQGLRLMLVSSGRDGEARDAITDLPKPQIRVPAGTWLATASGVLTPAITVERELPLLTPLGPVVLGRATVETEVVLVSPGHNRRLAEVLVALEAAAQAAGDPPALALVDGAFDRLAAAAPGITDTIVLAVGAAYSPSMKQTLAQAAFLLDVLHLPETAHDRAAVDEALSLGRPALLVAGARPHPLGAASPLEDAGGLLRSVEEALGLPESGPTVVDGDPGHAVPPAGAAAEPPALVLPGALGDGLLQTWIQEYRPLAGRLTVIVPDATHVLAHRELWRRWRRLGGAAAVRHPIRVAAVTANPYSPVGSAYEPGALFAGLCEAADGVPVFDLVQGLQCM